MNKTLLIGALILLVGCTPPGNEPKYTQVKFLSYNLQTEKIQIGKRFCGIKANTLAPSLSHFSYPLLLGIYLDFRERFPVLFAYNRVNVLKYAG